ncbi:MAG: ABC transporter ATP-binding protein [Acidimicrobiales bacterium]
MSSGEGSWAIVRRGLATSPGLARAAAAMVMVGITLAAGRLAIPVLFQQILDRGLLAGGGVDGELVGRLLVVTATIVVVVGIGSMVAEMLLARLAERALAELRVRVLAKALDLSVAEHSLERRGDLVARVTGDLDMLSRFLDWGAFSWITNSILVGASLLVMLVYSWQLTAIVVVVLSLMLPILRRIQRRQQLGYSRVRARAGALLGDAAETVGGLDVIRALGHADASVRGLEAAVADQERAQVAVNRHTAVLFTVADIFGSAAIATVIALAAIFGPGRGLELGEVIAFIFLVTLVLIPLAELTEVLDDTARAMAGWGRAVELLERDEVLPDPAGPRRLPPGPLGFTLDAVSFAYDDDPVLSDLHIEVEPGTSLAVVGATGSGKTTFVRLLCRLADPTAGIVRLGGVDLREVAGDDRRRRVRMVPQDGFLFATSVLENVLRGRPGATEADAIEAMSHLGLEDWVAELPCGIRTGLGPRGQGLSVGERQLVALIRAQLADPGLLVLDEATSSLDPVTEKRLTAALDRITRERTTVSVAHRLSTAERADRVLVFDGGELVEDGSHHELLTAGGHYASLHAAWQRGTASEVSDRP